MSTTTEILTIMPPDHLVQANQVEIFFGRPIQCSYCHGKGIFDEETTGDSVKKNACPICGGSGQIQAKVLIEWRGIV